VSEVTSTSKMFFFDLIRIPESKLTADLVAIVEPEISQPNGRIPPRSAIR